MRKISFWARNHPRTARIYIVIIKILLALMAWFVGRSFSEMDTVVPESLGFFTLLIFIAAALLYPSKMGSISPRKYFYLKQKSCDFILATCTFIMMVSVTNNQLYRVTTPSTYANSSIVISKTPTAEEILKSLEHRDKKSLTRQEKRILKQEFKKQLKIYVKAKITGKKDESGKAGLIILTIIGALGALYLVAALSCSLSCNGSEGAALAVAILGVAGVIWGTIAIIRRIKRGPRKKIPEPAIP